MSKAKHTHQQELDALRLIPVNISDFCREPVSALLHGEYLPILNQAYPLSAVELIAESFSIQEQIDQWSEERESIVDFAYFENTEFIDEEILDELIARFGRDAYGMYLPFHYYGKCWGIYLFKEVIETKVRQLHMVFNAVLSVQAMKILYYYAVYRHELFHYQVERYCTKLELIKKEPVYTPLNIRSEQVRNSEDWLEEALAESAVISSTLVRNRTNLKRSLIKEIYEYDLKSMPPGYRDYHCKKFGGSEKAHQLFAAQISENNLKPFLPMPPLVSIKGEFSSIDRKVPTYLVSGFRTPQRVTM